MSAPSDWGLFMDRVIDAQRAIAKHGASPYQYTIYVAPEYYEALESHMERTILLVQPDSQLVGTAIVLRHEVRA